MLFKLKKRTEIITTGYFFILPFFLLFSVFMLFPVAYSLYISLFRWQGLKTQNFIGLNNFVELLRDDVFLTCTKNSFWYAFGCLGVELPLALFFALILNHPWIKFKNTFRIIYFIPVLISSVVVSIIFFMIYDYNYGLLNYFLKSMHVSAVPWLRDREWVKISIIMMVSWRWIGYGMVFFLAGLQGISKELYEAAFIDGANKRQTFFHITLPQLKPIILFMTVVSLIGSFQLFAEIYVLTGGGPGNASMNIPIYLYRNSFEYFQMGYGAAIAWALFAIIFTVSFIQIKLFGAFREE